MSERGPRPPTGIRRKARPSLGLPAYDWGGAGEDPAMPGSGAVYKTGSPWPDPEAPRAVTTSKRASRQLQAAAIRGGEIRPSLDFLRAPARALADAQERSVQSEKQGLEQPTSGEPSGPSTRSPSSPPWAA
eukprot:1684444-Amphidinium_carterae.1